MAADGIQNMQMMQGQNGAKFDTTSEKRRCDDHEVAVEKDGHWQRSAQGIDDGGSEGEVGDKMAWKVGVDGCDLKEFMVYD